LSGLKNRSSISTSLAHFKITAIKSLENTNVLHGIFKT
jgi:hypothetical protein